MTRTVEQSRELDINWCNREGLLEDGSSGTISWTRDRDGEEVSSIRYHYRHHHGGEELILRYTITHEYLDVEPRDMAYSIKIDRTPCNFGGTRPWFRCPRCDDRVGKLYHVPQYDTYVCRDCGALLYRSQEYTSPIVAARRRTDNAIEKLNDNPFSREAARELYEAQQDTITAHNQTLDTLNEKYGDDHHGPMGRRRINDPPPFEEWLDQALHKSIGRSPGGRSYGYHGRCTATAKTTGERCRQPASGDHGKCHYHGGARGSGIGEDQTNHAAEQLNQLIENVERKRERDRRHTEELLADLDGGPQENTCD